MKNMTVKLRTDLLVQGKPLLEEILVREVTKGTFELLKSPGIVFGLAAGDCFELDNPVPEGFRVISRSGNAVIQVYSEAGVDSQRTTLLGQIANELGGSLDGATERVIIATVPMRSGLSAIESLMARYQAEFPSDDWQFGNIYDKDGEPLDWWRQ